VWIAAGTIPRAARPDGSTVAELIARAASIIFDSAGAKVACCDKIHMFDVDVDDAMLSGV